MQAQADLAAIRKKKTQIVAAHRMKKGVAGRQAVLPAKADAQRKLTAKNMEVGGT